MRSAPRPGEGAGTMTTTLDSAAQRDQGAQTRLALGALLLPIFFVAAFAVCIIGTYHKPHPNGIALGVVGPPAHTAQLRAGIEHAAGAAFDVSAVATPREAARDVRRRDLDAALVPTASPERPATVIVAGGGGRHRHLHVHDRLHDRRLPRRHRARYGHARPGARS